MSRHSIWSSRPASAENSSISRVGHETLMILVRGPRRLYVVASPPYLHLFCSETVGRLGLVEPREAAIVALIQAPALLDGYP